MPENPNSGSRSIFSDANYKQCCPPVATIRHLPTQSFDTWEAITPKTYLDLKTFIHEAYAHHLTALQLLNIAGTQGNALNKNQNVYNVLGDGYKTDSGTKMTVAMQVALITETTAITTGSTPGSTYRGGEQSPPKYPM